MTLSILSHQSRTYTVTTPVYEGPLDLLLHLIERAELDITRLALAQVTNQYLEHLHALEDSGAEEVSAFLVIAARLLQIKSELLLPRPPVREQEEEDLGDVLARQLIIYKRFKELAILLAEQEAAGLRSYLRLAPSPKIDSQIDLSGLILDDLLAAAQYVFGGDSRHALATVVSAPRVTIREKVALIVNFLQQNRQGTFTQLLLYHTFRLDVVVTFLALLELVKRNLVLTRQERLFGEIEIEPTDTWEENSSFELEFGE